MKLTRIKSIRPVGKAEVFDIEVAEDHSYIANGLVVHNSASNPNLMQLPARKDIYNIRDMFMAPRGYKLVCIDYAQLEIRVMTLYCKDANMIKILCDPKGDIHQNTSDEFGVDRSPTAKRLNFLMLYGGGSYMLAENLTTEGVPTTHEQAKAYVDRYNQVYSGVREYRLSLLSHHRQHGFVYYGTGRRRWLDNIDWDKPFEVHKAETTLANNTVQGLGQDFLKASIVRSDPLCINPDRELPKRMTLPTSHRKLLTDQAFRLEKLRAKFRKAEVQWILQIHDEVIYFVKDSAAYEIAADLADLMTWPHYFPLRMPYCVPITTEGGVGETWQHAKSKKPLFHVTAGFPKK